MEVSMTTHGRDEGLGRWGARFLVLGALAALVWGSGCGGGATDDIEGSCLPAPTIRMFGLDETIEEFEASPRDLIDAVVGTRIHRIKWVPNCSSDTCASRLSNTNMDCEIDPALLPTVSGSTSEITLTIEATEGPATARTLPEGDFHSCGVELVVPARVSIRGDDDSIAWSFESTLWATGFESGALVTEHDTEEITELGGALGRELAAGTTANVMLGKIGGKRIFALSISNQDGLLLEGLMLPDKECEF
ncbi:MAG: hypothetical protein OEZ06_24630 [Myxococcales bacterium]|nr:hypothetical protein [Myxococcales bacterium]